MSNARPRLVARLWAKRRALLGALIVAGAIFALSFRYLIVWVVPGFVDGVLLREIGHHLSIESLDFEAGSMRLVAHGLVLSPIDGGPPVATCSRAEARIDLTWFLRGVYIEDLDLEGVRIRGQRLANGSLDVVETIVAARARHPTPRKRVHIERLRSRSVTVVITDPESAPVSSTTIHTLLLDVLAQRLGTMRLDPPALETGNFTVLGSGGDLADRVSIAGEVDLRGKDKAIRAKVALAGADLSALVCLRARAPGEQERVDVHGEVGVVMHYGAGYELDLELAAANLSVDAVRGRLVSVRAAAARVHLAPEENALWREVAIQEPRISVERHADGSLAVAGMPVAGPEHPDAPPARHATGADLLDRLEAGLVSSRSLTAIPATAAHGSYPWPALPESFRLENGELRFGTELAVRELSVVERIRRGEGPARILAEVDAVSPGIAEHVHVAIDGALAGNALAGSVQLSVAGVTTEGLNGLARARPEAPAPGELGARATFELERESRTRFAGKVDIRDVRFQADGESLARLDGLTGELSLALDGDRPSVRVSRLVVEGAWAKVTRSSTGDLLLAGMPPGPARGFTTEPAFDLTCDHVEVRRLGVRLDLRDASPRLESDLEFDGTLAHLVLGEEPGLASVAIHGSASGLARGLSVEGRVFSSRVSPAAILDVRATGLRSPAIHVSQDLALALDEATLEGRVAWALVPGTLGGREVIARISSLVLADRMGPALSLDAGQARASFPDSPNGVVELDGVELVRPLVTLEHGPLEHGPLSLTVARALTWKPADPSMGGPDLALLVRPKVRTLRIHGLRVEDGEVDLRDSVRIRRIEARAVRHEVAEGRGEAPLELDLTAEVASLASQVHVVASFDRGTPLPRLRAEIDARGLDVAAVCPRWPGVSSCSAIHAGTLHAGVEASVRLLDASLAGELAVSDLSLEDDRGDTVFSLARGFAREASYQPWTGELFVGALDLERPSVALVREPSGELVVGGFDTGGKVHAFSDEACPAAPAPRPQPGPRSDEAAPGDGVRVEIDHLSAGGASIVLEDRGAHDAHGPPPVWTVTDGDGCADRLVFGRNGFEALNAFFVELSLGDGSRLVADGSLVNERSGLSGWATLALRDLGLERFSPYAEVTRQVKLERGTLTLDAVLTLTHGHVEGDMTVVSHRPRVRRLSASKPAVEGGSERGSSEDLQAIEELDGDASLEVPFEGERSDLRVNQGLFVGRWLGSAFLDAIAQPFKLLRPMDSATGWSVRTWFLRKIYGPKAPLSGPVTARAVFAPGGASLSAEAARAIATVAPYASGTERVVSLRAVSGVSDRELAARAAQLAPKHARELWLRFGSRRAALEDERRERAGAERAALERGESATAEAIRGEVVALEKVLAKLDVSLDDLANRIVASGPAIDRARSDEALRALARERIEVVRAALRRAGVEPRQVRVRLALLHGDSEQDRAMGSDGVVEVEVQP